MLPTRLQRANGEAEQEGTGSDDPAPQYAQPGSQSTRSQREIRLAPNEVGNKEWT